MMVFSALDVEQDKNLSIVFCKAGLKDLNPN